MMIASRQYLSVPGESENSNESIPTVYPNPIDKSLNLVYDVKLAGQTDISLYDLNGQKVKSYFHGKQSDGKQRMNFSVEGLAPGSYYIMITIDGIRNTKKVVKIE